MWTESRYKLMQIIVDTIDVTDEFGPENLRGLGVSNNIARDLALLEREDLVYSTQKGHYSVNTGTSALDRFLEERD